MPERDIEITVLYEGVEYTVKTYPYEYRNLMMLLYDRVCTDEFGDCLGMGKCGTCLIQIIEAQSGLTAYERNEDTTISKAGLESESVRLSCQILVDHHLDGLKIVVK